MGVKLHHFIAGGGTGVVDIDRYRQLASACGRGGGKLKVVEREGGVAEAETEWVERSARGVPVAGIGIVGDLR